jgi:hypothetical protein
LRCRDPKIRWGSDADVLEIGFEATHPDREGSDCHFDLVEALLG